MELVGFELSSQGDRGKNPEAEGQEATAEGTIPGQEQQQRALHGSAWEWAHPEGPCGPSRGESRCWWHSGIHQTHPKFHHQIPTPTGTSCAHPGWEQRGACSSLGITPGLPWRVSACEGVRGQQGQGLLFLGQQLPSQVDDPFVLLVGLGEGRRKGNVRNCWAFPGVLLGLKTFGERFQQIWVENDEIPSVSAHIPWDP